MKIKLQRKKAGAQRLPLYRWLEVNEGDYGAITYCMRVPGGRLYKAIRSSSASGIAMVFVPTTRSAPKDGRR